MGGGGGGVLARDKSMKNVEKMRKEEGWGRFGVRLFSSAMVEGLRQSWWLGICHPESD